MDKRKTEYDFELITSMYVVTFVTIFYSSFSKESSEWFEIISNFFGWGIIWLRRPTLNAIKYGISAQTLFALSSLYCYSILNISFWVMKKFFHPEMEYDDIHYNIDFYAMIVFSTGCTLTYIKYYVGLIKQN